MKRPLVTGMPAAGTRNRIARTGGVLALVAGFGVAGAALVLRPDVPEPFAVAPIEARPSAEASHPATPATPPTAIALAPAPDPRLMERTRYGLLPRIGPDGARPSQVYARPSPAVTGPQIAILVTGLGISQTATADAIAQLPPAVSLAFAPYGTDLERAVGHAREAGHEVMLEVPMEPFDYPDTDPGPHTLRVRAPLEDNLQRLHWVMGRFTGYTGLVNTTGAKLAGNEAALTPIMTELAGRGLVFLDDSAPVPLHAGTSQAGTTPARSQLVPDAAPRSDAIDMQLETLEALARERGLVIATARSTSMTVDRIRRWARTLREKGLHLVPVSAALEKPTRR